MKVVTTPWKVDKCMIVIRANDRNTGLVRTYFLCMDEECSVLFQCAVDVPDCCRFFIVAASLVEGDCSKMLLRN